MNMLPDYVERKSGKARAHYDHPLLEPILKETYGVMVYQEQVQKAANVLAGYSLGEADILRRAMGKKKASVMEEQRAKFVAGAAQINRIDAKLAGEPPPVFRSRLGCIGTARDEIQIALANLIEIARLQTPPTRADQIDAFQVVVPGLDLVPLPHAQVPDLIVEDLGMGVADFAFRDQLAVAVVILQHLPKRTAVGLVADRIGDQPHQLLVVEWNLSQCAGNHQKPSDATGHAQATMQVPKL